MASTSRNPVWRYREQDSFAHVASRLAYPLWLCCVVGFVVVGATGCEPKPEPSQPPVPVAEPVTPPPVEPAVEPATALPPATPAIPEPAPSEPMFDPTGIEPTEPQPAADESKTSKKPIPRPEKLADWKKDDYINAKRENDPRLIEAMEYLASTRVGDPAVAEFVAAALKFIKPEERPAESDQPAHTPPPAPGAILMPGAAPALEGPTLGGPGLAGPSQPAQLDAQTIVAAVHALAVNNTDPARAVLRDIVTGELTTDDDRLATVSAIQALLEDPASENDALMLRVLTEPEKIRKPGGAGGMGGVDPGFAHLGAGMSGYGMGTPQPLSAENLYEEAKQRVDQFASESFRIKLVRYLLTSPQATAKQKEDLGAILQRPNPQNVAPQLLIYQAPLDVAELKTAMEKFFTEISSVALGHVLGLLADQEPEVKETTKSAKRGGWGAIDPGTGMGGPGPQLQGPSGLAGGLIQPGLGPDLGGMPSLDAEAADLHNPEVIYPLARKLWHPKTVQTVVQRIGQVVELDPNDSTLALARTMPVDPIRASLYSLLLAHHDDGPGQLFGDATAGFGPGLGGPGLAGGPGGFILPGAQPGPALGGYAGDTGATGPVMDPGFLVVVKMLPREDKMASKTTKRTRSQRTPAGAGGLVEPGADMMPGADVQADTPSEKWMDASESLLKQLCQQCQLAAEMQKAAEVKTSDDIPVKPHPKANITARYQMKWPEEVAEKLEGKSLDPLEIHYMRIDETTQFSRLTKYYQRAAKTKHRTIGQNDAWFDLVKDSDTPGRILSCDVLITRAQGVGAPMMGPGMTRGRKVEPEEAFVIHILTIEMNDPTGGKSKPATEAPEP